MDHDAVADIRAARADTNAEMPGGEGGHVRELRARLGLSQEQLAKRLGVSFVTVNRWETGHSKLSASARRRLAGLEDGAETLPVPPSSFVGRDAEITSIGALLETSRLVTLVGPGGVGKTRLALELVKRARRPQERVIFVPLDSLADPPLVDARVAAALGLRDKAGTPAADALVRTLGDGPCLLVLDGAERVVAASPATGIAALAAWLLAGAPGTRILVTSRRITAAPGEQVCPVPPLTAADAALLFSARARERVPGFDTAGGTATAVGELCGRLDGLPLAIELAAGWVGTLSVEQILQRGSEIFGPGDGSKTLYSVAESSYALLRPSEQDLLAGLSVFAESFTLDDAQAVIGAEGLLFGLRELVDSSWLVAEDDGGQQRYRLLSTLREYAAQRLGHDAASIRERHAMRFLSVAARSEDELAGAGRAAYVHLLEESSANLDAALDWAAKTGNVTFGLTMSAALWRWWLTTGRLSEGRRRVSSFLAEAAHADPPPDPAVVAEAQRSEAVLSVENGAYEHAIERADAALDYFSGVDAPVSAARAATVLGASHRFLGDFKSATEYFDVAAGYWRQSGHELGIAGALNNQALMFMETGDTGRARRLLEEVLAIKRQLRDPRGVALGLHNLGHVLQRGGQAEESSAALTEAAEIAAHLGDRQLHGAIACTHADLCRDGGHHEKAIELYRTALSHYRTAGTMRDVVIALRGLGLSLHHLGRTAEARRMLREGEALAVAAHDAPRLSAIRDALATLARPAPAASTRAANTRAANTRADGLTARQAEVLGHVSAGMTNKDIASRLHLSVGTVERHLATCYRKLGLRNRSEATRYALEHGLAPCDRDT